MTTAIEHRGNAQAAKRTDPKKNGPGGSIGDIATHAYHLAGFVTSFKLQSLTADLATFVEVQAFERNANVMTHHEGGTRGLFWSSQVALGKSNGGRLRVFGETGSFQWFQEQPNELIYAPLDGRVQLTKRDADDLSVATKVRTCTPPGHPEGYLEAFANLYAGFAEAIRARHSRRTPACWVRMYRLLTTG